jgi:hypothetical protein
MARFDKTYCSNCGREFGHGNSGFSHCKDHRTARALKAHHERNRKIIENEARRQAALADFHPAQAAE